ncbi:MAG: N-acetylneuraminate synthase [Ignavibacteria bacterium]|nr:MAG: N-acetylneuraminate synthase [Ignavibacteria bacterium]KAF0160893.1 MAG: N-acetylneuraminate synthase [Ignavibacteria bacterium]
MSAKVKVGSRFIGQDEPVYVIAEVGINHNGSLALAKKLIDGAVFSGCDAVKFQKRTPELCVPQDQWKMERDTPWGRITYLEYKHKIEFGFSEYEQIDEYCKHKGIDWFVSAWDEESVEFIEQFNPIAYKIASATLTDEDLLIKIKSTNKPVMLSTGMSTMEEIGVAVNTLGEKNLLLAQSTSSYPCKENELNLKMIETYKKLYPNIPIGYSGHETGLAPTLAAVALGAAFVERHITLDRAMWGTDQAASVEVNGMFQLVKNIRDIEKALGDGKKKVYTEEMKNLTKMRKFRNSQKLVG